MTKLKFPARNPGYAASKTRGFSITIVGIAALFLIACSAPEGQAQQSGADGMTISHVIDSQYPEQKRILMVQLPKSYHQQTDKHYPVLYILDGKENLGFTTEIVNSLVSAGKIPEIIIVGLFSGRTRENDYLPDIPGARFGGRSDRYLKHIELELLPFVNEHFRTTDFRILSGHSYGGVFTLFAMTENPTLFSGYLTQSQMLNKSRTAFFIPRVKNMLAKNLNLSVEYFFTIGNERKLVPGYEQLKRLFSDKAPASFHWSANVQAGAKHMETRQPGIRDGLLHVFENNKSESENPGTNYMLELVSAKPSPKNAPSASACGPKRRNKTGQMLQEKNG